MIIGRHTYLYKKFWIKKTNNEKLWATTKIGVVSIEPETELRQVEAEMAEQQSKVVEEAKSEALSAPDVF